MGIRRIARARDYADKAAREPLPPNRKWVRSRDGEDFLPPRRSGLRSRAKVDSRLTARLARCSARHPAPDSTTMSRGGDRPSPRARIEQLRARGLSLNDARAEAARRLAPRRAPSPSRLGDAWRKAGREKNGGRARQTALRTRGLRRNPGSSPPRCVSRARHRRERPTYSLFEELLLRPLPVVEPDRLVNLEAPGPKAGTDNCNQSGSCEVVFSYPMFRDLERSATSFSGVAAHRLQLANMAHERGTFFEMYPRSGTYYDPGISGLGAV